MKLGYFDGEHPKNNVYGFLERHLEKHPDRVCLRWASRPAVAAWIAAPGSALPHEQLTFAGLEDLVARVAAGYLALNVKKGDRAILFVPMSPELYVAMFALQKIGAIPVFLDSWARRQHLAISAEAVAPRIMISFERAFELCAAVPALASIPIKISLGPTTAAPGTYAAKLEDLVRTPSKAEVAPVSREHTALITFTTGSSGVPKGANRSHRFLAAQHYALDACIPYAAGDVDLPVFPIFSLNNLAGGVTTVIPAFDVGTPAPHDPHLLLAQIQACGVTTVTLSPSLLNGLSGHCLKNGLELGTLRRGVAGGAAISRENVADYVRVAPQSELWVLYGSTEAEPIAHVEAKDMLSFEPREDDPEWVDEGVNVGHFADDLAYRFIRISKDPITISKAEDWREIEVEAGDVGELIVAGEHVCGDYYNNPEAFQRAKIRDERGVVWHRTGDLGRLDERGYLWLVGRVHNAIARGGTYAFPVRAEIILKRLPFVEKAAFLGMPHPELGESAVCVVVPKGVEKIDDHDSRVAWTAMIQRIMKKNGVPVDATVFRAQIPMDPRHHSKVEYDVLRAELLGEQWTSGRERAPARP